MKFRPRLTQKIVPPYFLVVMYGQQKQGVKQHHEQYSPIKDCRFHHSSAFYPKE